MHEFCIKCNYYYNGKYHEDMGTSHLYRLGTKIEDNGDMSIDIYTTCELTDFKISVMLPQISNKNTLFYSNGYQSESPSNEYFKTDRMPKINPIAQHFMRTHGWSYKSAKAPTKLAKTGEFYGYNLCYFRQNFSNYINLHASLDEKSAYTRFTADMNKGTITMFRDFTGTTISTTRNLLHTTSIVGEYNQVFDDYFARLRNLGTFKPSNSLDMEQSTTPITKTLPMKKLVYYSTYPQHKSLIHERIIMNEFNAVNARYRSCDTLMIEDGYCLSHTDWCHIDRKKFPSGIKNIVSRLHVNNKKIGIWLAPLLIHPTSSIAKQHPDWLIKKGETPIILSPNWGGAYALDTTIPQVCEYIKSVVTTIIQDWNFDIIKFDSLYVAGAIPRGGKTSSELDCDIINLLRECTLGKVMMVSGSTLPALYHSADYVDIAPALTNSWDSPISNIASLEYPSSKHCIQTLLTRRYLRNRAFKIDTPVELRCSKNSLSVASSSDNVICSLLTSSKVISSSIDKLSKERLDNLDKIQKFSFNNDIMINYITNNCIIIKYNDDAAKSKYILNFDNPKLSHMQ